MQANHLLTVLSLQPHRLENEQCGFVVGSLQIARQASVSVERMMKTGGEAHLRKYSPWVLYSG